MYKILLRKNDRWHFAADVVCSDIKTALEDVDSYLDFYPRRDIKIVTEVEFDIDVTERKHGILD